MSDVWIALIFLGAAFALQALIHLCVWALDRRSREKGGWR